MCPVVILTSAAEIQFLYFYFLSPLSPSLVRNVSSSLRGSQTAALRRLGQIENRIRSRNQAGQWPKSSDSLTSDLGISPPPAAQSLETAVQLSVQSSSEQSLREKHFLKYNTAVAVSISNSAAAQAPRGSDFGLRSRSKAADAVVPSVGLETKVLRVMKGVSLESDEDMRKLLGDSLDSSDNSFLTPVKLSSGRTSDKVPFNFVPWPIFAWFYPPLNAVLWHNHYIF